MSVDQGIVGIIANPAAGKDVRRLLARASVFDNQEKQAIVRRVLRGLLAVGAHRVAYLDDRNGIVRGALDDAVGLFECEPVAATRTASALDTTSAARAMRALGCKVLITLGGDGTNRAVALGWPDAPLLPVSTGTNNVFPDFVEGTVVGAAAGLLARGLVPLARVARQRKLIHVTVEGEAGDLALIDAVLSRERFVGARALLAPDMLAYAMLTRADPAAVGMTAIGGLVQPHGNRRRGGLWLTFGAGAHTVDAPIAPGYYQEIGIRRCRRVRAGETVEVQGPGVLAFDGERERTLLAGQHAHLHIAHDGPWVVSVERCLKRAARKGLFVRAHAQPTGPQVPEPHRAGVS